MRCAHDNGGRGRKRVAAAPVASRDELGAVFAVLRWNFWTSFAYEALPAYCSAGILSWKPVQLCGSLMKADSE